MSRTFRRALHVLNGVFGMLGVVATLPGWLVITISNAIDTKLDLLDEAAAD